MQIFRKQTNENFEETKINTNDKNNLLENNIELNKPKNFVNQSLCNLIGVLPSLVNYNDSRFIFLKLFINKNFFFLIKHFLVVMMIAIIAAIVLAL